MKKTLAGGATFLAVFAVLSKIIGAVYRIPLTNIIGAEGIGMYQLVFPVYSLLLTLPSGISIAVSRLVAERRARLQSGKEILRASMPLVLGFSVAAFMFLLFFGRPLAILQGNPQIKFGFMFMSPALLFVALSGVLRGWFQGNMNMKPTAI
jgi:stage V sporulation protein B